MGNTCLGASSPVRGGFFAGFRSSHWQGQEAEGEGGGGERELGGNKDEGASAASAASPPLQSPRSTFSETPKFRSCENLDFENFVLPSQQQQFRQEPYYHHRRPSKESPQFVNLGNGLGLVEYITQQKAPETNYISPVGKSGRGAPALAGAPAQVLIPQPPLPADLGLGQQQPAPVPGVHQGQVQALVSPDMRRTAESPRGQSLTHSVLQRQTENLRDLYALGRKLGQGQFGTTYLCIEKATGREYACKSIAKRKLISQEDVDDVRREIQIMHHLSGHPNVVTIKGAYEDSQSVHLVMELCAGGELFDRIIQRGHYSEAKAAHLTRVIVGVVEACHSLNVMHRDLKPENFLLSNRNEDAPLKATDFGLSVFFRPGEVFTDVVGSPYYVAPEVLRKRYGPEADVWSAGVILYILLSGVPPFWAETEQGIFEQVLRGELDFESDPWPVISDSAKDLIRRMLNANPQQRLKAHEVLRHPWIREPGVAPDRPIDPAVQSRMKQFAAMNKLKKLALRVIAESLSEEEIAGLREMFKMMDTDNSGSITFDELTEGLKKVGSDLKESEIRQLMDAADVDCNGSIDYGEFLAATLHMNKIEREENLLAAFQYFDADSSGYITVDELSEAWQKNNLGDDTNLHQMLVEVDSNNDGRIDYHEFVTMMRRGNGGVGRRTMRNSLRASLRDVVMAG